MVAARGAVQLLQRLETAKPLSSADSIRWAALCAMYEYEQWARHYLPYRMPGTPAAVSAWLILYVEQNSVLYVATVRPT